VPARELRAGNSLHVGIQDGLLRGIVHYDGGEIADEKWTEGYKEVRPGWWFPMVQGYHIIENSALLATAESDRVAANFIAARRDVRVKLIEINRELGDSPFEPDFKEGVTVHDARFGGMVSYQYKKDMSEQDWADIREKAIRRAEADEAATRALDSRIGQGPPPFPQNCKWLNSKPLTWSEFRGKAVLLQFWGISCGPCHTYIRMLKRANAKSEVIVLGIHQPEQNTNAIMALMTRHEADGPVCVDVEAESPVSGFGALSRWFGVRAMPSWIVIGPDGMVAGHSMQSNEALQLAHRTASVR
jgi:thiol-disulfide isomerase/thioredoxin